MEKTPGRQGLPEPSAPPPTPAGGDGGDAPDGAHDNRPETPSAATRHRTQASSHHDQTPRPSAPRRGPNALGPLIIIALMLGLALLALAVTLPS